MLPLYPVPSRSRQVLLLFGKPARARDIFLFQIHMVQQMPGIVVFRSRPEISSGSPFDSTEKVQLQVGRLIYFAPG